MTNEFGAADLQVSERQLMTGQNQGIWRQQSLQAAQRTQVEIERIAVRLHCPDADVWGDLCENLVCREKQFFGRAMEHELFGRMAISAKHFEYTATDVDPVRPIDGKLAVSR